MGTLSRLAWASAFVAAGAAFAMHRPDLVEKASPRAADIARQMRSSLPPSLASWLGAGRESDAAAQAASAGPGKGGGQPGGQAAGRGGGRPPVSVILGEARRQPTPLRLDAIGTVQPAATVALRPRVDSQVVDVPVAEGATVKAGDVIIRLDSRQIEAQIRQAEAQLSKDKATLEQAERDAARTADLVERGSGAKLAADNARTALQSARALVASDQAALDNLRVQLSYYTIVAPISGRIGAIALKKGAIARQGEASNTVATINQTSPIYVAFSAPQARLPELREAMAHGGARTIATPQGGDKSVEGRIAFIDNAIDATTGAITARALFDNADETLWPGQFANVRVVLRMQDDAVVAPREAVMTGQNGSYVFVIEDGVARQRAVKLDRVQDDVAVIASGLAPGEKLVVDGQAMLIPGARAVVRGPAAAGGPGPGQKGQGQRGQGQKGQGQNGQGADGAGGKGPGAKPPGEKAPDGHGQQGWRHEGDADPLAHAALTHERAPPASTTPDAARAGDRTGAAG